MSTITAKHELEILLGYIVARLMAAGSTEQDIRTQLEQSFKALRLMPGTREAEAFEEAFSAIVQRAAG